MSCSTRAMVTAYFGLVLPLQHHSTARLGPDYKTSYLGSYMHRIIKIVSVDRQSKHSTAF